MNQTDAKSQIINLWRKRPETERRPHHVLVVYGELAKAGSPLLSFKYSGDKYQIIKCWLLPYTVE